MRKVLILLSMLLFFIGTSYSQVSINKDGSRADASAMLDVKATHAGILIPRMTTLEMNKISEPATGLLVFNISENQFYYYNSNVWVPIGKNTEGVKGDKFVDGDDPSDAVYTDGNVGIGTVDPQTQLHVMDNARFEDAVSGKYLELMISGGNQGIQTSHGNLNLKPATGILTLYASGHASVIQMYDGNSAYPVRLSADGKSYFNGGNVGIGNQNPKSLLQITSDSSESPLRIQAVNTDGLVEALCVGDDGMVGIGTNNPKFPLDIRGNNISLKGDSNVEILVTSVGSNDADIELRSAKGTLSNMEVSSHDSEIGSFNSNAYNGSAFTRIADITMCVGSNYNGEANIPGKMKFTVCNGGEWKNGGQTDAMLINYNGNVGIGTMDPQTKLHVMDNARFEDSISGRYLELMISGGNQGIQTSHGNLNLIPATGVLTLYTSNFASVIQMYDGNSAYPVRFSTSGISYFNGGRVGIGNINPGSLLQVTSDLNESPLCIQTVSSGGLVEALYIDEDGNVGIGDINPERKLHINGVMKLEPISEPSNASKGDMYMDSGTSKLMVYDGNDWKACW